MLITVPRSLMIYPAGYGNADDLLTFGFDAPGLMGLRGLGDDDSSDDPLIDDSGGGTGLPDTLAGTLPDTGLITGVTLPSSLNLNPTVTLPSPLPPTTTSSIDASFPYLSGGTVTAQANLNNSSSSLNSYVTNSSSAPLTANGTAQILTAAGIATAAAAKGITAASGPYQVPGTSLVYNPATGQIINAAGALVGSAALPSAASIASYLPLIIGIGAIAFLVSSMQKR